MARTLRSSPRPRDLSNGATPCGDKSGSMAVAFDEMNIPGGDLRPAYQELARWLKETPPEALEYRRQEAELLFRRIGITFAVYGDSESTERLIPFDVIPRIMSGKEWTLLEKGLKQRVKRAEHVPARHLSWPRHPPRRDRARRSDLPEPGVPPRDERPAGAARRLRAHRRHRHHQGRCRGLHRAGGQCAHAVRRVLHAGKPRDHDAAVSGSVRPPQGGAGRALSGRAALRAALGRAATAPQASRPSPCSRPASTTPPITSTPSSPTSSASSWSRAATSSSRTTKCSCGRPRA